ncbi:MAG: hypothetical protein R6V05_06095 [Candidatus Brocadiia bacterium]
MALSDNDRSILRDLAKRVREAAELPVMAERRELWKQHNALRPVRPMILVFPEGAWGELITEEDMQCAGEEARRIEWGLRARLFYHKRLHDDTVIEPEWVVHKAVNDTGHGLAPRFVDSTEERGAWGFDPVLRERSDLDKLSMPKVSHDEEATNRAVEQAEELLGDILPVRLKGVDRISFHPMAQLCKLRGLGQVMMDMATAPEFVHEAMSILAEGHRRRVEQYVEQDLLDLNNDGTYHSSGGVGYTDEMPQDDYDGRVRPCDMWASAEAQELAQVSPAMHAEFALQYEKRLLEPFGLNGYGCCEDLTHKLDDVLTIPNIRRISISPFADVPACAEKLGGDYILSWKPHPAHLCGEFNPERIRAYIRDAVEAALANGCVLEMILKDTHTCEHHPERFTIWTQVAREVVEQQKAI